MQLTAVHCWGEGFASDVRNFHYAEARQPILDRRHAQGVRDVTASTDISVTRTNDRISLAQDTAMLGIGFSNGQHVAEESAEIAEEFQVPCQGCEARFEMSGDDPDMDLFNDYLIINERLQEAGSFVIFDPNQGKLLFDA